MRNTLTASPKQPTEQARINPSPHQSATLTASAPAFQHEHKPMGRRQRIPSIQIHRSKNKTRPATPHPLTGTEARQIKPATQQQAEEANAPRNALQGALATPGAVRALPRAPHPPCQHDDSYASMRGDLWDKQAEADHLQPAWWSWRLASRRGRAGPRGPTQAAS
jgi:hypothetical protein